MKTKILVIALLFALAAIPLKSKASDAFTVFFYYNDKTSSLSFDKFVPEHFVHDTTQDVSLVDFAKNPTSGEFILKLYQANNTEIVSTEFNKKPGAFQLSIPYFSLATNLKIFVKSTDTEILSGNISNLSTCNGNGICEYEKGETTQTCLGDCANSHTKYSQETLDILNKNNGSIKDPKTGVVLLQKYSSPQIIRPAASQQTSFWSYLLILFAIIVLVIVGWLIFKRVRDKGNS